MSKVLIINGSPRQNGNTATALKEIAVALEREGVEVETVCLGTKQVRSCIACNKCFENGDGKCVFNDDIVNQINEKAKTADGFIIGSPVYYGQPAGSVVSAVQRMLYSGSVNYQYKPVANVVACRRGGATAAIQTMNMPWLMVNCPIVSSQYWNIAYGRREGEAAFDGEGMQTMRTTARNMAWALRHLDRDDRPEKEQRVATHFVREDLTADKK